MAKTNSTKNGKPKINTASPGHALKTLFMDPLGLTAYRVAKDTGMTPIAMSQILRGQRAISPSVALKFGMYFGVEPDFWLSLQAHADLVEEAKAKPKVAPCLALQGRAFVLKETKVNGSRNWQVIMVKRRAG